jgi:hypothetical protein
LDRQELPEQHCRERDINRRSREGDEQLLLRVSGMRSSLATRELAACFRQLAGYDWSGEDEVGTNLAKVVAEVWRLEISRRAECAPRRCAG